MSQSEIEFSASLLKEINLFVYCCGPDSLYLLLEKTLQGDPTPYREMPPRRRMIQMLLSLLDIMTDDQITDILIQARTVHSAKCTSEEFNRVVNLVAEEFGIRATDILHSNMRLGGYRIQALMILTDILFTTYKLNQEEISELMNKKRKLISDYLCDFLRLNKSHHVDAKIIERHQNVIKKLSNIPTNA